MFRAVAASRLASQPRTRSAARLLQRAAPPSSRGPGQARQKRSFGSGGGGDMPVPQSASAQLWAGHPYREGWESTMAWWYGTSALLLVAVLGFSPNTDIESWARQEAQARLAAGGGARASFGTHTFNLVQESRDATWDKFSVKSVRMTEEDDDDDEEEEEEDEEGEGDDEDDE